MGKSNQSGASLFDHSADRDLSGIKPLAARMRPLSLSEFVGQEKILGPGSVLLRAIKADALPSFVLWGPPGSGKTTIALMISRTTRAFFAPLSAVTSGVADLRAVIAQARDLWIAERRRTILFVDEVHRFNKAQQDVILPHVEEGTVILIGATTENPSFEVNSPLLSRARVFRLEALSNFDLLSILNRAIGDEDHGLGRLKLKFSEDAVHLIANMASGDARQALNTLELVAQYAKKPDGVYEEITAEIVEKATQNRLPRYDKNADLHFDTISAFIKSMRASDPDATIYWLARMLEAGEDLMFIARRVVIFAAEDIGLADPNALTVAIAAQQAAHFIGYPEAAIPLTEASLYMASAPKSNASYKALLFAKEEVKNGQQYSVPLHLRNPVTNLMKKMNYGENYKYPHEEEGHFSGQRNLPQEIISKRFYHPSKEGYEANIKKRLDEWWGSLSDKSDDSILN